jgi:hypothetical protein
MKLGKCRDLTLIIISAGILIYTALGTWSYVHFHPSESDFKHFYWAALAMINKTNIYASGEGGYIYPPLLAFIMIPLAHLNYVSANMTWMTLNFLFLLLILTIGLRMIVNGFHLQSSLLKILAAFGLTIILSYNALRWEIILGQTDLLILLGITLALFWLDKRPWIAGVLLGAVVNIKYLPLLFLPFLCLRGRWKTVAGILAGTVAFAFLPAIILGWQTNWHYLEIALRGLFLMPGTVDNTGWVANMPKVTWYRNITITSGLTRIFLDHAWNMVTLCVILFGLTFTVFLCFWRMFHLKEIAFIWRNQSDTLLTQVEFYSLLVCLLAFSPQYTLRHFILLLNVNLIAAVMLINPIPKVKRWLIALGVIFMEMGINLRFSDSNLHSIWHYIGGPGWTLLPFIFIITYYELKIIVKSKKVYRGTIDVDKEFARGKLSSISSGKFTFL